MSETEGQVTEQQVESTETSINTEPSWYWDNDRPGEGDKPSWLKDKYKTVTDQAKAYVEAEKFLGNTRAPDDYDLTRYEKYLDKENENVCEFVSRAKKNNMSQEMVEDLLEPLIKHSESLTPNIDVEMAKLGENAQARLDVLDQWAANTLSDKAITALGNIVHTAEAVELLDEIRQKFNSSQSQPPSQMHNVSKQEVLTVEKIQQEMNDNYKKYMENASYREEINRKLQQVLGDS